MWFFKNHNGLANLDSTINTWNIVLFALPLLLFLPVIYYSMATPFALVDDYGMCYFVEFLDNSKRFSNWLHRQVLDFSYGRYRPFFDFYNMVSWKFFGATPWLHHLTRWFMHFTSIGFFAASFVIIARDKANKGFLVSGENQTRSILIPLGVLIYIWLFFPNVPAARLGPQEVFTVFFLGLCNLMLALIIIQGSKEQRTLSTLFYYVLFYAGYLGLSVSKEINIAVMLWIVMFYFGLLCRGWSWKKIFAGLPLLLIFFYTLKKIFIASNNNYYGVEPLTFELITDNLKWISKDLFQSQISIFITTAFIVLLLFLLFACINQLIKRQVDNELIYIVLIAGELISLYLILTTSWAKVLRYWYVILPVFTMILAFSARSALEVTRKNYPVLNRVSAIALSSFVIYFIGCNYYNFLLQSVAQHSLRQAEAELINEVSKLHDQEHYIYILVDKTDPDAELLYHLVAYYRNFSPRFHGKKYMVHTSPPEKPDQPYYVITRRTQPGNQSIHKYIIPQSEYTLLNYAYGLSSLFQQKKPLETKDAGVHNISRYEWIIYSHRS